MTGIVVYTRICSNSGHYSAFCRSLKDSTQWFHLNDTKVYREGAQFEPYNIYVCISDNPSEHCYSPSARPIHAFL